MDISEYAVIPNWEPISLYEIRNQTYDGTETYSKEEILAARSVIIDELKRENIEQYKPDLILMDRANRTETTMVVHAMISDDVDQYDGNESRNRTFYIEGGKIVRIKKGRAKEPSSVQPER